MRRKTIIRSRISEARADANSHRVVSIYDDFGGSDSDDSDSDEDDDEDDNGKDSRGRLADDIIRSTASGLTSPSLASLWDGCYYSQDLHRLYNTSVIICGFREGFSVLDDNDAAAAAAALAHGGDSGDGGLQATHLHNLYNSARYQRDSGQLSPYYGSREIEYYLSTASRIALLRREIVLSLRTGCVNGPLDDVTIRILNKSLKAMA